MTNKLIKCISGGNLHRIVLIIKQGCLGAWGYLFSNLWKRDSLYTSYSYLAAWLWICPNSSVNICNSNWKHSSETWSIWTWDHHAVTETLIRNRAFLLVPPQSVQTSWVSEAHYTRTVVSWSSNWNVLAFSSIELIFVPLWKTSKP